MMVVHQHYLQESNELGPVRLDERFPSIYYGIAKGLTSHAMFFVYRLEERSSRSVSFLDGRIPPFACGAHTARNGQ